MAPGRREKMNATRINELATLPIPRALEALGIGTEDLARFERFRMEASDAKGKPFRDRQGRPNIVARVRRTRKGQRSGYASDNCSQETKGRDGSGWYVIRRAREGAQAPHTTYCSCPAQRFHAGYGNLCKHGKRLLREALDILERGEREGPNRDIIIYDPVAILEALHAAAAQARDAGVETDEFLAA